MLAIQNRCREMKSCLLYTKCDIVDHKRWCHERQEFVARYAAQTCYSYECNDDEPWWDEVIPMHTGPLRNPNLFIGCRILG